LHRLGFEFSRHREVENQPVLEFYLNLYERPELLPSEEAAPQTLLPMQSGEAPVWRDQRHA
jgi:hypothetical protein